MQKLNERIDYSTEGLVKALNEVINKVDSLSVLVLKMAESNSHNLEDEAFRVYKM
ncbi:hypothetical protein HYX02_08100 [Candidatus Woesearchaeota archaeon]|nr:hypothetical protein [Candidatus Woesearchaeota archaeon]